MKPVKWTKKATPSLAVASATTRVGAGASGSKGAAGGTKKTTVLVQKCCIPASGMLVEAYSVEFHES
jgi:hypothetical protein